MTRSQALKLADIAFARYIKKRDTGKVGYCVCKCCNFFVGAGNGECGHVMKRRHESLRYDERNAYLIHVWCNRQDLDFRYLDKKIIEQLESEKHTLAKYTTAELLEIEKKYKLKLKEL